MVLKSHVSLACFGFLQDRCPYSRQDQVFHLQLEVIKEIILVFTRNAFLFVLLFVVDCVVFHYKLLRTLVEHVQARLYVEVIVLRFDVHYVACTDLFVNPVK